MTPESLLQEYESNRGLLRELPDHDLLTLVARLATEYVMRRGGAGDSVVALSDSVVTGIAIARRLIELQREVLEGASSDVAS